VSALDPPPNAFARLVAWLAGRLWAPRSRPGELRRVLVVRPDDRVGNALLTIPLVRSLQRALPSAQIDLLLAASRASVAEGLPGLNVVRFDKRALLTRPFRFLRELWRLRGYDAAIDASHWHSFSLTAALLARWASRGAVVGVDRGHSASIYSIAVPLPPPEQGDVLSKMELMRGLGLPPPREPPPLETALGHARANAVPGSYVAINPGARKPDHRFPAERFGAIAAALDLPCIILWGPGEKGLAETVRAHSNGRARLAPPTDLDALAAYFRSAACVVTNDTGPMHLAVACGAPVVALQLSSDAARWSHQGARFAGVRDEAEAIAAIRRLSLTSRAAPAEFASFATEEK
jgi:ADP-heptose:LPS heptosyltransferase